MQSIEWLRQTGSVNYVFCHLRQGYLYQGMMSEAEAALRQATGMAEDNFGSDNGLKAIAEIFLGYLLYIKDEPGHAQAILVVRQPNLIA